ncbi:MAG: sulfotransferase [Flavobacteriales bacterium]
MKMSQAMVNFLIIGAAKSGTTSLHHHLAALPGTFFSPIKEPNYHARADIHPDDFSRSFRANHALDLSSYFQTPSPRTPKDIAFVRSESDYLRLFEGADAARHPVIGEASTSTLWSPTAMESVRQMNPEAKVLVVIRDPVERMFSHYLMARKYGFTTLPFKEAVERDLLAKNRGWGQSEQYFELGCYGAQLAPWIREWPEDNLRILRTADLNLTETWMNLAAWLGLCGTTDWAERAASPSGQTNVAGAARYGHLNRFLTASGLKSGLAKWLPTVVKNRVKRGYYDAHAELPVLQDADRDWATRLYTEDQELLRVILKTTS